MRAVSGIDKRSLDWTGCEGESDRGTVSPGVSERCK